MAVLILGSLLALAYLAGAVFGGLVIDWDEGDDDDRLFWILFLSGGALLLVAGLFAADRSRWLATTLMSLGAIAGAIASFWTIVIPIAAIALIVLSILWARRAQAATSAQIS